jgi:prophage antirepressor-like protein
LPSSFYILFQYNSSKFINEVGLYEFIFNSNVVNSTKFKEWVTETLLPTLRRDCEYDMRNAPPMAQEQMETMTTLMATKDNSVSATINTSLASPNKIIPIAAPSEQQCEEIIREIIKISVNGVLWMLASTFAIAFGYSHYNKAIRDHISPQNVTEYEKIKLRRFDTDESSTTRNKILYCNTKFINVAGLYEFIFNSKMDNSIKFQDWVTGTLLPTLRRDSEYDMRNAPPAVQQ